jgi:flagellar biosynthesis/type III secretory pathway M-ring protein FliF/YscJ
MERILTPPSPESVRAIRELVTAALGLVPARGDHLVIESLPFESTLHAPPPAVTQKAPAPAAPAPASRLAIPVMDWRVWSGIGVAAMLLFSGLWLLRRRQKRKRAASQPRQAGALAGGAGTPALEGRDAAALSGSDGKTRAIAQASDKLTPASRIEVLIEELRNTIDGDPELAASVLRCWIEEEPQA